MLSVVGSLQHVLTNHSPIDGVACLRFVQCDLVPPSANWRTVSNPPTVAQTYNSHHQTANTCYAQPRLMTRGNTQQMPAIPGRLPMFTTGSQTSFFMRDAVRLAAPAKCGAGTTCPGARVVAAAASKSPKYSSRTFGCFFTSSGEPATNT